MQLRHDHAGGSGPVTRLSQHFIERWKARVGAAPTVEGVNRIISGSLKIRHQKRLWETMHCGGIRPFVQLAEYWNHRIGIILKIDERDGTAVTVIAPLE